MEYVNVIIDHRSNQTDRLFTYGSELPGLRPGDAVAVPFAQGRRLYTGYVHSLVSELDIPISRLRLIDSKKSTESLPEKAIAVAEWMQRRCFCRLIDSVRCFAAPGKAPVRRKKTAAGATEEPPSAFLVEPQEGAVTDVEFGETQSSADSAELESAPLPTAEQASALARILPCVERREARTFLIHGVTNSGKTEIYLRTIAASLAEGRSAVMLVPEIALTGQTIERFYRRFGEERIAVLHSRLSVGERRRQWERIQQGGVDIVVGARSAIFAPLKDIGAIVVDEEHETSYKSDMTPKYDTVEVAVELGRLNGAVVLLGSATPSMTSYRKSETGEFERIELFQRYNREPLPEAVVVDMREELQAGNRSVFSRVLYDAATECLDSGRQIILFLNRRGYTTFLSCRNCGYVMKCATCGIAMIYHKSSQAVVCHYCGRKQPLPDSCPECHSRYLRQFGAGTEKVEETAALAFPGVAVERLDMDAIRAKGSLDAILKRFQKGKTKILIGTQLVAKGLDFANVGLVGVVSADVTLNLPDYRAAERTFQLVTQAAGRAGRGNEPGRVVIQTYEPGHYALQTALEHDYRAFYRTEATIRQALDYPPFGDLIRLMLSSREEADALSGMSKIRELFLRKTGQAHAGYVLPPQPAPIYRTEDRYQVQMQIKCLPQHWPVYQKVLWGIRRKVLTEKAGDWLFSIDVNPFGLN